VTNIHNIGTAAYVGESPYERPDLYVYAACHQHYHEVGFAGFELYYTENNSIIVNSTKKSYCVETSEQWQFGSKVPCLSDTTCDNQGLEPGNTDIYGSDLDCQWLDITDLYLTNRLCRWYKYTVHVNHFRSLIEYSYENDATSFPVFLPCAPTVEERILYPDYMQANPNTCCARPSSPLDEAANSNDSSQVEKFDGCPLPWDGCPTDAPTGPEVFTCSQSVQFPNGIMNPYKQ